MDTDKRYMSLAISLAGKAAGRTSPNPLVGAVIVKDGRIVGKGYHKRCGLPHAEICAMRSAGARASGATMYVTLEPCDHYGRTPPCTDAIIKSGIKKVVMAMRDPNPITDGRGIRKLREHGIKTKVGILEEEARSINRPFIKSVTERLPFVRVKIAESIDGKIATRSGDSRWITGEDSRRYVHRLRRSADAVMVGIGTVLKDDPMLLSALPGAKQPIRVVVDSRLKILPGSKLLSTAHSHPVVIAATKTASPKKAATCERKGANVLFCRTKNGRVDLRDLMRRLSWIGVSDLLVEGGGELVADLLKEKLVDRFVFFISPKIIGGRDAKTPVEGAGIARITDAVRLKDVSTRAFKDDIMIEGEVSRCSPV